MLQFQDSRIHKYMIMFRVEITMLHQSVLIHIHAKRCQLRWCPLLLCVKRKLSQADVHRPRPIGFSIIYGNLIDTQRQTSFFWTVEALLVVVALFKRNGTG